MEELELRDYLRVFRKWWLMIILIPIVSAIASGAISYYVIHPKYDATTTILVNQPPNASGLQYSEVQANQAIVNTYTAIIQSEPIEQTVINDLKLPFSVGELDSMISVSSPTSSQVIQISVDAPSNLMAVQIANDVAKVFQNQADELMKIQNVQIVANAIANPNASPVSPNKKQNIVIAFVLGLIISLGLAFLFEYLDNKIRNEESVERYLGVPTLGIVADFSLDHK